MDRQPGVRAEHLPHRHLAPAQQRMLDDGARVPVHPATRGETDPQRPAAGSPGEQRRQPVGGPRQHHRGLGAFVLHFPPGHHPPAQVQQRDRGVRHSHVHRADHEPGVVQVDRLVRPPHAPGAPELGGLADEPGLREPGTVVGHRRRRQAGQPGDGAARDRAVLQHGPQHDTGAGAAPVVVGDTGNGGLQKGSRGTGHGNLPEAGPTLRRLDRRAGSRPPRLTSGGDRWPCPGVAGRRSDATRSTGPGQPCPRR